MKITVWTNGDPSVGIAGEEANIDFPYRDIADIDDNESREDWRKKLIEAFSGMFDDRAKVMYEDEFADGLGNIKKVYKRQN